MKSQLLKLFCLIALLGCGERPQVDPALAPYLENFYSENPYVEYVKDIGLIFADSRDSNCNVIKIDYVFWQSIDYKKCLVERPLYKCLLDKEINLCGIY